MPIPVLIEIEDPDTILNANMYDAGAIVRLQHAATKDGIYSDVSTAAVVSGTRSTTIFDPTGTFSTWYRARFENAGGTRTSIDWTALDWATQPGGAPFQVGGEEAGYLCSLTDVKQRLFNTATMDATNDEDIAELIRQVSTDILGHTGREFVGSRADETRTFDLDYLSTVLYIPGGIRSITTLNTASSDQPDTAGTYTATTSYYLRPLSHERTAGWPATRVETGSGVYFYPGRSTVQIVGTFGWAAVPPDIAGIATSAVVRRFQARQSSSTGVDLMVGSADMGFRTLAFLSPAERAKLDWYAVRNDG